jgi:hypothetical protein
MASYGESLSRESGLDLLPVARAQHNRKEIMNKSLLKLA